MTTPLTDLLECIRDGGGQTGMILCSTRLVCGASPTVTTDNGFTSDSLTRNAAGDYTVYFANAFAAAPVCWAIAEGSSDSWMVQLHSQPTTALVRVQVYDDAGNLEDCTAIHIFAIGA